MHFKDLKHCKKRKGDWEKEKKKKKQKLTLLILKYGVEVGWFIIYPNFQTKSYNFKLYIFK